MTNFVIQYPDPHLTDFQIMIIEIGIGIAFAVALFALQIWMSRKVDKLIEKKATLEKENKEFECKRIIEHLQEINEANQSLKTFLANYKVEDTDQEQENLRVFHGLALEGVVMKSIWGMDDAIKQLQGNLNNKTLRLDFIKYIGAFRFLPDLILNYKMPQQGQKHQPDQLLEIIKEQNVKIEDFIKSFTQEMDSTK